MISRSALFGVLISTCIAVCLFQLKHKVNEQERELAQIHSKMHKTQEAIHILQAEWSYLNEPGRLQKLAEKHLKLAPSDAVQLVSYENIHELTKPRKGTGFGELKEAKFKR
jgi:cell division protein FtsL